jgi:hypothetical protein
MTDSVGDTYSPLPYMLDAEGFDHIENGAPIPMKTRGESADKQGWALRRRGDRVEVSRRHKSLFRGPLATRASSGGRSPPSRRKMWTGSCGAAPSHKRIGQ